MRDVTFSATKEDTEPGRLIRLARVYGYVFALSQLAGKLHTLAYLVSLHDHKGDLTVSWEEEPNEADKEFFAKAWGNACIGDGCDNVTREVVEIE